MTGEFPSPEELNKFKFEEQIKDTAPALYKMICICGKEWNAAFPYGVNTKFAECPQCHNMVEIPK